MNPLDFVRNKQAKENFSELYGAALEFSDPVEFGMQALMLQEIASLTVDVCSEGETSLIFSQTNLRHINQTQLDNLADGQKLTSDEAIKKGTALQDASSLYRQMAHLRCEVKGAAAQGKMPFLLEKVSALDKTNKSTLDWTFQKLTIKQLRKEFKAGPSALAESLADKMLDIDKEMTTFALLSAVEMVDVNLLHTPLANKYNLAELRQSWAAGLLSLNGASKQNEDSPITRLVIAKTLLQTSLESFNILLQTPQLRLAKTKSMRQKADTIRSQTQFMESILKVTIVDEADSYDHQLAGSNISDEMKWARHETTFMKTLAVHDTTSALPDAADSSEIQLEKPEVDEWYVDPIVEVAGLTALADTVRAEHQDLRQVWEMSRNQLKKLGLLSLIREMQSDNAEWTGKVDIETYSIARTLVRLQEYADGGGMPALATLFEREDFLRRQLQVSQDGLRDIASESPSIRPMHPAGLESLYADFEAVRGNWDALWPLILEFWPNQRGAEVVERLELLFGLMPVQQVSIPEQQTVNDFVKSDAEENDSADDEVLPEPFIDPELVGIADAQLDILVFPNTKVGLRELMDDVRANIPEAEHKDIEWWRLKLLHRIKAETGGTLYRTRPGSFGHRLPWYALHIETSGVSLALLEHPVEDNASYLIRDEYDGFWQELVGEHNRNTARMFGQKQIIHPDRALSDPQSLHYQNLRDQIADSLTVKV